MHKTAVIVQSGVPISTLTAMGGGNDAERLAAAKSLCRFVLRIPKGASDNDQEQSPTPTYTPPTYTPLDATSLLPTPEMQPLDATSLLPGATSSRSPFRGEALDATTLLPGVKEDEVTPASVCASAALPAVELHDAQAVLQAIDMQSLVRAPASHKPFHQLNMRRAFCSIVCLLMACCVLHTQTSSKAVQKGGLAEHVSMVHKQWALL